MVTGIKIEQPVAHVHTQNGLAESFIKRLQLIARPLLMRTKLPYMFQLLLHNAQRQVPKEGWEYMSTMHLHL
ncbi:hypothetical protein CDL12_04241 [Handroanthus impetiginosus]|uniref:Uncharacterized protein n=1 Tax=Handroanthus impetiginosus TaxID=429701 RepID=A0A2G9HZV8_9LAMI|nr:hypothetical protein CDL12_04241 [Handroanthus impetiginosus]